MPATAEAGRLSFLGCQRCEPLPVSTAEQNLVLMAVGVYRSLHLGFAQSSRSLRTSSSVALHVQPRRPQRPLLPSRSSVTRDVFRGPYCPVVWATTSPGDSSSKAKTAMVTFLALAAHLASPASAGSASPSCPLAAIPLLNSIQKGGLSRLASLRASPSKDRLVALSPSSSSASTGYAHYYRITWCRNQSGGFP